MTVSSETDDRPPQSNASDAAQESADDRKERKARKKVRAAWISFVGRIVAQVIGAAATVSLGFIIANRVHSAAHAGVASVEPSATAQSRPRAGRKPSPSPSFPSTTSPGTRHGTTSRTA